MVQILKCGVTLTLTREECMQLISLLSQLALFKKKHVEREEHLEFSNETHYVWLKRKMWR